MAILNFAHREITAKIVYFGAPSAGSSTNVRTLHEIVPAREKTAIHSFGPEGEKERIWFFSYVPESGRLMRGFDLRWQVYAVPGGIVDNGHRREVLGGTDAVVFVADARRDRDQTNLDSLLDLERLLRDDGLDMAAIPMVIQVNHTDATDARPPESVVFDLNPYGFPVIDAVARDHKGVLEAHERVTAVTVTRIRESLSGKETSLPLVAVHEPRRETDEDIVARHLAGIQEANREEARSVEVAPDRWAEMQVAGEIEVSYQPADFAGTRPRQILAAIIEGDTVSLDLLMDKEGGTPRRLKVTLLNRPMSSPAGTRPTASSHTVTPGGSRTPGVLETVPDRIELSPIPPSNNDLPPLFYGVAGLASGVLIGLLIGVIYFL